MTSDPQKPSIRTTFELSRLLHLRPRRRSVAAPPKEPVPKPAPPERWVVFELGGFAHHLRDDDLFPAERTFCGKPAVDLDMHPLPHFNTFPADYRFCRVCCYLQARHLRGETNYRRPPAAVKATAPPPWTLLEALLRIREQFAHSRSLPSLLTVCQLLHDLADYVARPSFQAPVAYLASLSSISVPTTKLVLAKLATVGLVQITQQRSSGKHLGAPNIYTLLGPVGDQGTLLGK